MDPIKILKRAWSILWSYRTLWVFGLILALTAGGTNGFPPNRGGGGGGGGSSGGNQGAGNSGLPSLREEFNRGLEEMQRWYQQGLPPFNVTHEDISTMIGIGIFLAVLIFLMVVVFNFARYITETGLIHMVDQYEQTGVKASLRQGFNFGWSRTSWRLFLINLLIGLPGFLLFLVLLLFGLLIYLAVNWAGEALAVPGIIAGIGAAFLILFLIFIITLVLTLLRPFFWRACALEGMGVMEALRSGYGLVRRNWKSAGLMWLVMLGVRILYQIGFFLVLVLLLPLFVLSILGGVVVGGLPTLLVAGISSLFLKGAWPWVVGVIFGLPLFLLVASLPALCVSALEKVFTSSVWTLTYRELVALEKVTPEAGPTAPEALAPQA